MALALAVALELAARSTLLPVAPVLALAPFRPILALALVVALEFATRTALAAEPLTVAAVLLPITSILLPVAPVEPWLAIAVVALRAIVEGLRLVAEIPIVAVAEGARKAAFLVALVVEALLVAELLAQLLLGGRDDAEVMLCVLEVVLRRHGVAAGLRVTGELAVFLGHMLRRARIFTSGPFDS